MIKSTDKLKDIIDFIVKSPFSRHPIYSQNKDNIIGILDVDDVLKYVKDNKLNIKIKTLAKPVIFVPESKEIDDLLFEFEGKEIPMAMIVDEYGTISGLITITNSPLIFSAPSCLSTSSTVPR